MQECKGNAHADTQIAMIFSKKYIYRENARDVQSTEEWDIFWLFWL